MIDRDLGLKIEIAENIKQLLNSRGWKQSDLSRETGISKSTLSDYMNCKTLINPGNVQKVASAFKVSKEEIDPSFKSNIVRETSAPYFFGEHKAIPYYGDIAAGAPALVESVKAANVEKLNIPSELLGKHHSSTDLFSMHVNGDSMNTIIPNGSYVICKPISFFEMKDDDIVVFSYDGEYSVKRVRCDKEDKVIVFSPESTNKKFRDIVVPFETQRDLKIYAKVVWYSVSL